MPKSKYPKVLREDRGVKRVYLGVRVTPAQKAQLARLGSGSLVLGFDRALAAASAVEARS